MTSKTISNHVLINHKIALLWNKKYGDARAYTHLNEYFLSYDQHNYYNHIHIFRDRKDNKNTYLYKVNNKHVKRGIIPSHCNLNKWVAHMHADYKKYMTQIFSNNCMTKCSKSHDKLKSKGRKITISNRIKQKKFTRKRKFA